ncbi:MAG: DUF1559 domain-containing protein [Pirellulales bacterium]
MANAALNHHASQKTLPAGGWGYLWIGDPDRGAGRKQPGGWIYNILPYIEETALHDGGKGFAPTSAERKAAGAVMIQTPLDVMNCPSRRPAQLFETTTAYAHFRTPNYSNTVLTVARSDYAGNGGSVPNDPGTPSGPTDATDAASSTWTANYNALFDKTTGVFVAGNTVKLDLVRDGTGKTYLLGEKKLQVVNYYNGVSNNDNESMYMGANADIHSWATTASPYLAEQDGAGTGENGQFGSAHTGVFQMAFCDGSVHRIPFEVDPAVHQALANRKDGIQVNTASFE